MQASCPGTELKPGTQLHMLSLGLSHTDPQCTETLKKHALMESGLILPFKTVQF